MIISFKLYNTSTNFQKMMNDILYSYLNKFYIIYLNDILIYLRIEKEYKKYIYKILKMLEKIKMILNLNKCKFNQSLI